MSDYETYKDKHGINHDAIENSREFLAIQKELSVKIKKAAKERNVKSDVLGSCHQFGANDAVKKLELEP